MHPERCVANSSNEQFCSSRRGPYHGNLHYPATLRPPLKVKWKAKSPGGEIHRLVGGWGRWYATYGSKRGVACFDLDTGQLLWYQRKSPGHLGALGDLYLTSPTQLWVKKDTGLKLEGDPLQLMDARTGEVTQTTCDRRIVAAIAGDDAIMIGPAGGKPMLVNVNDPSQLLERPWTIVGDTVAAADGRLFAGFTDAESPHEGVDSRRFACIDIASGATIWSINGLYYIRAMSQRFLLLYSSGSATAPPQTVLFVDRSNGQVLWRRDDEIPGWAAIAEPEGLVVAGVSEIYEHERLGACWRKKVVCRELSSGETVWEFKPDYDVNGSVVTGNVLWHAAVKDERKLISPGIRPLYGPAISTSYLIAYDLRTHEELWRKKVPGTHNHLAAYADGKLITQTTRSIICYETTPV